MGNSHLQQRKTHRKLAGKPQDAGNTHPQN